MERRASEADATAKREAASKVAEEAAAAAKREANTKHRARINREAMAALIAGGIGEDAAKNVIAMIARKEVPNVIINY